ncbi:nitrogen regulation protein NR(II) [Hydromonas duriensis]|uniref:histidine kinase n=1 Tax=Hydromonas duriensis TaxID=1527608 RepID=A0A4R6YBN6_9BURK|nr:nitrogen regulation protein NR(II) [Hydromonas duriensis]TDR33076.1 two-component system nitrogen regulation sensor histidine kinase GlnL [Hydromonas duriensis]
MTRSTIKPSPVAPINLTIDALQNAVAVLDVQARVQQLNSAAQMMWGSTVAHAQGVGIGHWFEQDETLTKLLQHMLLGKNEVCRGVLRLLRVRDDMSDSVLVHVIVSPLHELSPLSTVEYYCLECHQLGAYENVNQDAQWRAQMHNYQLLMRQLAHEVKNPLGGIRGAAQLLQDELQDSAPELMEYTEMMIAQVDRLKNMVDQFLVPYRQGVGQAKGLNIHEVCESVYRLTQIEFGTQIVLQRDYDVSIPDVRGVADYLQQLLLNLVQNAAQAVLRQCTETPKVIIRTRVARQCVVNQVMQPMMIELSVIDNGPGVSPEIYDTLFLPMVSQREGGTGLGLSVAMQIAQQHGGTIEVHSRVGHTQMRVLLPLASS